MDLWAAIAEERTALADQLAELTDAQWSTPSLCRGWTVRDVAAHLVVPHRHGLRRFAGALVRSRGSVDGAVLAREAARPTAELVADLRASAGSRSTPPGFGPEAPMAEMLLHGEDIRLPLGLRHPRPPERWAPALELLVGPGAERGFVASGRPALRLVATDVEWAAGPEDAAAVHGPAPALGLALSGRPARLGELTGAGVVALAGWCAGLR